MRRRRRCFPKRGRRSRRRWSIGPIRARLMPMGARRGRRWSEARRDIAEALGWRHDIILTSGATEAIAIVAARAKVAGRAYGATEHDAVGAAMGSEATVLPVDADGLIDLAALDERSRAGPALVAVQQVNNETGVIQPLEEIAERVRERGFAAACRLRAGGGQASAARRRLHRRVRAQARRSAGDRRPAGQGHGDACGERRTGEGLSPRHRECAGGCRFRGGAAVARFR